MQPFLTRVRRKLRRLIEPPAHKMFRLAGPPALPPKLSSSQVSRFLRSICPAEADRDEMATYCDVSLGRFLHTFGLASDLTGRGLELGANPYFMTLLLRTCTKLELTLANYFGSQTHSGRYTQEVFCNDLHSNDSTCVELTYWHFNAERQPFPFDDCTFDVVFFCEILEHLMTDPLAPLLEIKRILKPGGRLILTTPNVNRLENVARMLSGHNIYDPYSGHGAYGRHNREYTSSELQSLVQHAGFSIETYFSADADSNKAKYYFPLGKIAAILPRDVEVGEYHFIRARSDRPSSSGRPLWLYRSFG